MNKGKPKNSKLPQANPLTAEELMDYVSAFDSIADQKGCLTSGQFVRLMVALGVTGGENTATKILRDINKDGDAKVTRKEFLEAVKQPGINNEQIRQLKSMFDRFDDDNSGWATKCDVIRVLPELGLTEAEVVKQLEDLDADKDGKIRFEDFLRVQLQI